MICRNGVNFCTFQFSSVELDAVYALYQEMPNLLCASGVECNSKRTCNWALVGMDGTLLRKWTGVREIWPRVSAEGRRGCSDTVGCEGKHAPSRRFGVYAQNTLEPALIGLQACLSFAAPSVLTLILALCLDRAKQNESPWVLPG